MCVSLSWLALDLALVPTIDPTPVMRACVFPGTHVAGTAAGATYGIAPEANVIGSKVCGCTGGCPTSYIVNALQHAATQVRQGLRLIMSFPQCSLSVELSTHAEGALWRAACYSLFFR